MDNLPTIDTLDIEILMHRDAHFAGNFGVMLEYYEGDGVGVMPDFPLSRIKELLSLEEQLGKNLSEDLLPESAKEVVAKSKAMYAELQSAYDDQKVQEISIAISDLILSEKDFPTEEIKQIVTLKKKAVKPLIEILKTDSLYDPIYPGYGRTPLFAAEALGDIQDEKAIPALFEGLAEENFFTDEAMILNLAKFGKKADEFLRERLCSKPITKDNERAIMALTSFQENEDLAKACLHLLEDPEFLSHKYLATYLILGCAGLIDENDKELFYSLKEKIPGPAKEEFNLIAKSIN